jgi:uncharacterized membrane protein YoaK (UPF0700 family)
MVARHMAGDWTLPILLALVAGATDVIGFLGLGGLFTAHITGNLALVAAYYAAHGSAQLTHLLSVPAFMLAIALVRLLALALEARGRPILAPLLVLHALLLATLLAVALAYGPFGDVDGGAGMLAGMLAIAAMAAQNATVRMALTGVPPTAVMTTNMTQCMIDLADLAWRGRTSGERAATARPLGRTVPSILGFVAGCGAGALLQYEAGLWSLAFPALLAGVALLAPSAGDKR